MSRLALAAVVVIPAIYLAATCRHRGFVGQPKVVMPRDPSHFEAQLSRIGGATAARTGVWIDIGFIGALTVPSGHLLLTSGRPSLVWVAIGAAIVDLVEDGLLLGALQRPSTTLLRGLFVSAVLKYLAYLSLVAAVTWTVLRS